MSFLQSIGNFVSSNTQAQNLISQTGRMFNEFTTRSNAVEKLEKVSDSRLRKMLKLDNLNQFSCHSETASSECTFYAIYLPLSKIVWRNESEKAVRELCAKLEPITDVSMDKNKAEARLQSLMEVVWKEPDWAAIHYAAACGFIDYMKIMIRKDPELALNYASQDGRFPLNIAVERDQMECFRLLINSGANMCQTDALGRTVVHWAAATNTQILQELSSNSQFKICLEKLDGDGISPLGSAIRAANFESVKLLQGIAAPLGPFKSVPLLNCLLSMKYSENLGKILKLLTTTSPSIVSHTDDKMRSILHKAIDKQVLIALLKNSYQHIDINQKDQTGSTPLHLAVDRGTLDIVVTLLAFGGDVESVDGKNETPLIKAVVAGKLNIVKALLIFDAKIDPSIWKYSASCKNRVEVELLLKMADGSLSTPAEENVLNSFAQKLAIEYQKTSRTSTTAPVNLLSLDGGGIRGLVLIQILIELENHLNGNLLDRFDWLAGTSTGAILALALSKGENLRECRKLYFRLKDEVFTGDRPYKSIELESFLKEVYGSNTSMAEIAQKGKRVMVTTCLANRSPPELIQFRNYRLEMDEKANSKMGYMNPSSVPAWQAARCSSAAPTYFPSVDGKYMDGGLMANNPCCELISDVLNYNTSCRIANIPDKICHIGCVLSIGTGRGPTIAIENLNLGPPTGIVDIWTQFKNIVHLKNIFIEQIACADGAVVSKARSWSHSLPAAFFRFSPLLSKNVELDETDDSKLIDMLWETKAYMSSESASSHQLIDYLKSFA